MFLDWQKIASPPLTLTDVGRIGDGPSNRHRAGRDSWAENPVRPESELKTMTALTRWNPLKEVSEWNPFRELDEMHNRLSRFLGTSASRRADGQENITVAEWAPLVDITEDDKEYLIKAELPEVKKGDVKVRVEDGVLYISGERNFEKEEKGKRYHRIERAYGSFTRSFSLPEDADPQQVNADFKDGVLGVHVAKDRNARPKSIEVKVA
jgi:HSP20 family protein